MLAFTHTHTRKKPTHNLVRIQRVLWPGFVSSQMQCKNPSYYKSRRQERYFKSLLEMAIFFATANPNVSSCAHTRSRKGPSPQLLKTQHFHVFPKAFIGVDFIAVKHNKQLQACHFIFNHWTPQWEAGHLWHHHRMALRFSTAVLCVRGGMKCNEESLQKSVRLQNTGAESSPCHGCRAGLLWGCQARPLSGCWARTPVRETVTVPCHGCWAWPLPGQPSSSAPPWQRPPATATLSIGRNSVVAGAVGPLSPRQPAAPPLRSHWPKRQSVRRRPPQGPVGERRAAPFCCAGAAAFTCMLKSAG